MFFKCYSVLLKLGLKKLDAFTLPRPHEGKQIGLITPGTAHIAVFIARTTQRACNAPDGAFDAGFFYKFVIHFVTIRSLQHVRPTTAMS